MRPFRSFLLLLVLLVSLTSLSLLFPGTRYFPELSGFFPSLSQSRTGAKNAEAESEKKISAAEADTVIFSGIPEIDIPSEFHKPLGAYLDSLYLAGEQVRILYYGDSQIEGDRITFFLRQLLREGRAGSGPGLFLPVMPVSYTKSIWIRPSPDWKRYNYLSYKDGEISHNRLGPFMAFCRYLPEGEVSSAPVRASVRICPSVYADSAVSKYEIVRIFYSLTDKKNDVTLSVREGEKSLLSETLKSGTGILETSCLSLDAEDIVIEFEGRVSPDIYGISIESKAGIIVDNIPQRGSAGLEFAMIDKINLKESFSLLNPDIIILHYGLNIVRNIRDEYSWFRVGLQKQLELIKEVAPSSVILVTGVTDMASNEGDTIMSYRNIPSIVRAQRDAALAAGVLFWDAYEAMGGRSSIINWSAKKIPLAQSDYVHFTYPGSDTLSLLLTEAMFRSDESNDTSVAHEPERVPDTVYVAEIESADMPADEEMSIAARLIKDIFRYDPAKPLIFTTPAFWIFFLIVLLGFSLQYRKIFPRNLYLLAVSIFFYYKAGGLFLFLLLFVTLTDFFCGLLIYNSHKKGVKRFFILLSLVSNLGILAYFKYAEFFINIINNLLGTSIPVYDFLASLSNQHLGTAFDISSIILPVGISFFTFQSLSYIFDVYRGKLEPVRNIVDFGFYVSFFPQLVAGPIVRASEFIPQLYSGFNLTKREFSHAVFMISKGLIKKIVISDFIATNFIDRVFELPQVYSGFENLMAVYGYGLQIYCDFSGYTDIAIGLALVMGFRLPVNFNSPYKATGVSDFWKRWHISLSRWLRDYLYIPLGGNRKGSLRTGINLFITMLLGGLWHGADLRFIIWGALHGAGLIVNKIWVSLTAGRLKQDRAGRFLSVFLTFNFVSFCWIFFRAPDMNSVKIMFNQIFEDFSPGSWPEVIPVYSNVFLLMIAAYLIHFLPEKVKESYRGLFISIPMVAQMVIILGVAVLLYLMRSTDVMPFIYFRF